MLEARIGQAVLQRAVVGQQQQALAVGVEPPGRVHARGQAERERRVAALGRNWLMTP
ncbi:MAG: hypothetical protein U0168_09165 [Nannocystaceae bacterium]